MYKDDGKGKIKLFQNKNNPENSGLFFYILISNIANIPSTTKFIAKNFKKVMPIFSESTSIFILWSYKVFKDNKDWKTKNNILIKTL